MTRIQLNWLSMVFAIGTLATACQFADAQQASEKPKKRGDGSSWYYEPTTPPVETKSIPQQKAEARAKQRMARLDAMRWYGFHASRPVATGMPFTSMYSPAWRQPGGRQFAWYFGQRDVDATRVYR